MMLPGPSPEMRFTSIAWPGGTEWPPEYDTDMTKKIDANLMFLMCPGFNISRMPFEYKGRSITRSAASRMHELIHAILIGEDVRSDVDPDLLKHGFQDFPDIDQLFVVATLTTKELKQKGVYFSVSELFPKEFEAYSLVDNIAADVDDLAAAKNTAAKNTAATVLQSVVRRWLAQRYVAATKLPRASAPRPVIPIPFDPQALVEGFRFPCSRMGKPK